MVTAERLLEDIAILTGATAVFENLGMKLENIGLAELGRAKKVIIDKDNTTIIEGAGKTADIKARESNRFVVKLRMHPVITIVKTGRTSRKTGWWCCQD